MKETFVIIGWFFAIFLILFATLSFMTTSISGFPFPKEAMSMRCEPQYVEIKNFTDCKSSCIEQNNVDSYKIENDRCFCDVNKC